MNFDDDERFNQYDESKLSFTLSSSKATSKKSEKLVNNNEIDLIKEDIVSYTQINCSDE